MNAALGTAAHIRGDRSVMLPSGSVQNIWIRRVNDHVGDARPLACA